MNNKTILFVQPFGLNDPGGGAKIMRSLLQNAIFKYILLSYSLKKPENHQGIKEVWLPFRPLIPFLDRSRLARIINVFNPLFFLLWKLKFRRFIKSNHVDAFHVIPQEYYIFWEAFKYAKKNSIQFILNLHDDFKYNKKKISGIEFKRMKTVWLESHVRLVISKEMGEEYCRRYGKKEFIIVTDGVKTIPKVDESEISRQINIYFAGMFHSIYKSNFESLCKAVSTITDRNIDIILRGSVLPNNTKTNAVSITYLPFSSDKVVSDDKSIADLLYLPLPFDNKYHMFNQFSLSTKLILYLSFGKPILYHGPKNTALYNILHRYKAGIFINENNFENIVSCLKQLKKDNFIILKENVRKMVEQEFQLELIRSRFYEEILK